MVQSFRDLLVWQRAMQLTVAIYSLTKDFPREELYGLTSQIRRAAVSIPSNIAEGQGRQSTGEFKNFIGIARGSNFELQTQLEIACALKMGDPKLLKRRNVFRTKSGRCLMACWNRSRPRNTTDH